MKYIYSCLLAIFFCSMASVHAQDIASSLAGKQARKMKDSLSLPDSTFRQLYSINIQINRKKMHVRKLNLPVDSTRYYIQRIENSRDSLYHRLLTQKQYFLYKDKKRNLINNNPETYNNQNKHLP